MEKLSLCFHSWDTSPRDHPNLFGSKEMRKARSQEIWHQFLQAGDLEQARQLGRIFGFPGDQIATVQVVLVFLYLVCRPYRSKWNEICRADPAKAGRATRRHLSQSMPAVLDRRGSCPSCHLDSAGSHSSVSLGNVSLSCHQSSLPVRVLLLQNHSGQTLLPFNSGCEDKVKIG